MGYIAKLDVRVGLTVIYLLQKAGCDAASITLVPVTYLLAILMGQ